MSQNFYCWRINSQLHAHISYKTLIVEELTRVMCVYLVSGCLVSIISQKGHYTTIMLGVLSNYTPTGYTLSVLKRNVPKTLAFAFGLRLRSKMQRSKTRVLMRRAPNGRPERGCDLGPCVVKR